MTNQYQAVSAYGKAIFGEDVFDADFDANEEKDHLDGGHLEIVPRMYKVTSNNFTYATEGSEYEAALVKEREEALISGGHLVRADPAPAKKKAEPKTETKTKTPE